MNPILVLLLFAVGVASAAVKEQCNPQDKKVLFQIKQSFNNAYIFSSWLPTADCCTDWYMVECDPTTHRITSLSVSADSLPGVIPSSIGDLPYLKSLDLHHLPNLTGPISPAIAKLTNLEFLRLDFNGLTGPVPSFLAHLKNLSYINLSFNKLSGSLPPSLALAPSLDYLRLDRNRFTGAIPESFGSFKNGELYTLDLSHNQLSGPIPRSLGNLNLTNLDLSRNGLTGDASFLFGAAKTVQNMDLSRNMLAFNLSETVIPSGIGSLLLDHNKIFGSLPAAMVKLTNLYNLNVSYNRLCGEIPNGGRMTATKFDKYSYFHTSAFAGPPCRLARDRSGSIVLSGGLFAE